MPKKEKKAKPTIDIEKECPSCKNVLHITAYRKRTNEPVPAEYDTWAEIEVLGKNLPFDAEPEGDKDPDIEARK